MGKVDQQVTSCFLKGEHVRALLQIPKSLLCDSPIEVLPKAPNSTLYLLLTLLALLERLIYMAPGQSSLQGSLDYVS